ncbi:MAG: restriction endonuclease [Candidatus Raymondbacteria bacterium RifOxyA12_full_50_37]|uniref:Restriction endonuclease n=1 Tax=Candidatus Raymondbacteria bacterium RIFOXYD12_FULL_49_13 TaxID=1817890 RepID=A0A1F7FFQ3_UNCRA|nr:MAG: restriction endonuclease [Candidatus Raymondbacteria bacterium RifOxyA12_full_50_37]OGJ94256.1 MAG: restriction endonuclease [Candidatus Raymondbacteria bacterium RIFOXYA2_FULL_49_16]OGJ94775.1 MAG: restriction endonuclease [Candidatus Raymondbacteria bacterium RifOxyC12_full_50_8]OGJ99086.1 MAG: restriction endonuclease [Candidatus Raymondbacteria bacterium RIFOXYC2_FULL_50_21]OGK01184.1 MAG: restriction endonuclease [Candidatus Raymondbacteria bacterium RifOxyB12_full_50_8]OGK05438.1
MAIPDYQSIMLPLLQFLADKKEHSLRETIEHLELKFELNDDDKKQLLPSGSQPIFENRVGWARTYLKKALLLEPVRRGFFQITERGMNILSKKPEKIDASFLRQFPEFLEFQNVRKEDKEEPVAVETTSETPEESIESAYLRLKSNLANEIIQNIKSCSPTFFERLVIELLVKMGYGGSRKDAGEAIGKSGDGGIDGIIKEDKLGLDILYIQAKRWEGCVGRPEIQKFAGALQLHHAKKGIFITTSNYSKDAIDYVSRIESKIILIDGELLANLMIDNKVGVSTVTTYDINKIDSDYFTEE